MLAATKPAFVTINYGALKPGRPGTPVALADGQHLADLAVRLQRGAVITGRLTDRSGQPAPDVAVSVLRVAVSARDNGKSIVPAAIWSSMVAIRRRERICTCPITAPHA